MLSNGSDVLAWLLGGLAILFLSSQTLMKKNPTRTITRIIRRTKYKDYLPYILAQSKLETGNFTSRLALEEKNLFGMGVPTKRKSLRIEKWARSICTTKVKIRNSSHYVVIHSIEPAEEHGYTWGSPLGTLFKTNLAPERPAKIGKTYLGDTVVIENAIVKNLNFYEGYSIFATSVSDVYIDFKKENVKIIPPN